MWNIDNKELSQRIILVVGLISATASYFLAALIRYGFDEVDVNILFHSPSYIFIVLCLFCLSFWEKSYSLYFQRGFFDELVEVIKIDTILLLILAVILSYYYYGVGYSRLFLFSFYFLNLFFSYCLRQYIKIIIRLNYKKKKYRKNIMIVTTMDRVDTLLEHLSNEWNSEIIDCGISGLIIVDENCEGKRIQGIKVKASKENALEVIATQIVDEVFLSFPGEYQDFGEKMLKDIKTMGISVVLNVLDYSMIVRGKEIESFGGLPVIHFSSTIYERNSRIVKRLMDIIGSLIGLVVTFLIGLIIVPIIKIESPGPAIFSQNRIGRNGRVFKIYKFRSMYQDAEERKKALMAQNEMDGLMFKMTNDPRITRIGKFIRKTSIDEFPQFFNVLIGDMSLIGTRPPTVDEFKNYELHHRKRLAISPGLTGLWQVSGRSNITDFEEVVELDTRYIDEWSLGLDFKILLKTILIVAGQNGSK